MKSNTIVKLAVVMAIIVAMQAATMKKSESVLEFFNDLFSNVVSEESSRLGNEFLEGARQANKTVAPAAQGKSSNSSNASANNNGIMTEWLRISNDQFANKARYPDIILPDGVKVPLRVDSNYFRINNNYDEKNKDAGFPQSPLDFWFRITPGRIFYSRTKSDMEILGLISYTSVKKDSDASRFCIHVDEHKEKYLICSEKQEARDKVFCAMKKHLGETPYQCKEGAKSAEVDFSKLPKETVIEDKVIQPIFLIPMASKLCNEGWNYANGGKDWECTCKEGVEQSPINLPEGSAAVQSPVTPLFQYEEVSAKSSITTIDGELKAEEYIKIKYFQNSLRIFHSNFGKIVTLDGAVYVAEEIVFHTPSEHTINGKRYDMEMQIIHYGQSRGDISKQVVLSFLFQKTPGVYNKFIDDVDFFSLPNVLTKERDITNNLFIPKIFYSNSDDEIPVMKPFSFYTYQGSITFPPCTERTIHYVASQPIPIGSAPLQLIREALRIPDTRNPETGDIVVGSDDVTNNREIQPTGDRAVFYFDHQKYCGPDPLKKAKQNVRQQGHYEKVNKKILEYFYVNGEEPSGLPGSFVVSEQEAKGIPNAPVTNAKN